MSSFSHFPFSFGSLNVNIYQFCSILTSIYLSLCVCKFLSVPLGDVSATFGTAGHSFLLGTVPSLDLWGTHSCFQSLLWVLLLLRAKRALQLNTGASSSMLIPWVILFGSEILTFYLQPGLSPSTPSTLFCFFMSPPNVTCPKLKSWFHFHRPCFLPSASPY